MDTVRISNTPRCEWSEALTTKTTSIKKGGLKSEWLDTVECKSLMLLRIVRSTDNLRHNPVDNHFRQGICGHISHDQFPF
jgi:hypothetical protein